MGNKLCCDSRIPYEFGEGGSENPDQLIQDFMDANPSIRKVCPNPGHIFATVTKRITHFENGVYIGKISNNQRNELGLMMFKGGMYYEGEWLDNYFSGRGNFYFDNGNFYQGQWRKGLPQGEGLYVSLDPVWRYAGHWEAGAQTGKGKEIFEDGSYYEGDFYQGVRHGKGKFRNHDGRCYEGSFVDGEVEGAARAWNFNCLYEGEWKKGKPHGAGKCEWTNKDNKIAEFIGQYKNGVKEGFGQYREKDGITFKGNWKDGYITNVGVIIQSSNSKKIEQNHKMSDTL